MSQPPGQGPYGPPGQGGWGQQPPGQGGWGQPGQPPQYGQPGQYGPTGPGGPPGPYSQPQQYGTPGGPGGGGKRGLIIGIVAAVLVVALVGVVLFLTLGDDDERTTTTATPSATTTAAPPTTTAPPPTTTAPPSEPIPGNADFLEILPADFTDCQLAEPAGDGDLAHAACGASTTQPGPQAAEFYLYPDKSTLDSVFTDDVSSAGLAEIPAGQDCTTATGVSSWQSDGNSGLVACAIDPSGQVAIIWTDDAALVEGLVLASGGTQADLAALYQWWTTNSSYLV